MAITAKHLPLQVQNKRAKEHSILKWRNMSNIQRNNGKEISKKQEALIRGEKKL